MHGEPLRRVIVRVTDQLDYGCIDAGDCRFNSCPAPVLSDRRNGVGRHTIGQRRHNGDRVGLCGVRLGECMLKSRLKVFVRGLVNLLSDVAASDQRLGVNSTYRALGFDQVVHQWLRHRRVIALVVAAAAVTHKVNDNITVKLLAVVESKLSYANDCLGVIAIDVEDRRLNCLGDIRRVHGAASLPGRGGEANLVVDHDMDGAASAVGPKLGHLQNFDDDSLAGHCRIPVDHHREYRE